MIDGGTSERSPLATTFRDEEVRVMNAIFAKLQTGGDVKQLIRSEPFRNVHAKFIRMRTKLESGL